MSMTDLEQALLDAVPADGSSITNPELQRQLGWSADDYWEVKNRLVDNGVLSVARGRGGLVLRAMAATCAAPSPALADPACPQVREDELYEPISAVLNKEWALEKRLDRRIVHLTARQGRRDTGGRWSHPDMVVATQSVYPYVPGRHFDVISFEVKPSDAIDVTAVYEALAHRRAATMSYVVLHVPDVDADRLKDALDEVYAEAKKHGIGVITFNQPDDFTGWEEKAEPVRHEPDPRRLNDFLATQFPPAQLTELVRWFHG